MIANPNNFRAIIMNKRRENQITHKLKIYNHEIETTKSVKLIGIEIDNQLSFFSINLHIINLQYYIRQTKTEIKKRNRTMRTSLALSLTNYYLKFVRLITHLFPMLHFDATQ